MEKHKIEVVLSGVFTTIDVYLEGIEIPLSEINPNEYRKSYSAFEIDNPLDLHVLLKGWTGMKWLLVITVNDKKVYDNEGVFDKKGYVTFSKQIKI